MKHRIQLCATEVIRNKKTHSLLDPMLRVRRQPNESNKAVNYSAPMTRLAGMGKATAKTALKENKMIKQIRRISILILSFHAITFAQWKPADITFNTQITISSNKTEYLFYEDIFIEIKVENFSEPGPYMTGKIKESLIVTDANNVQYKTGFGSYLSDKRLEAGEIKIYDLNLISAYGTWDENNSRLHSFLPVGDYTIQCVWGESNPIESNTIHLSIKEPKGEEADALNFYIKCRLLMPEGKGLRAEACADSLLNSYPNSIYAPNALKKKIFLYKFPLRSAEKFLNANKQMLLNYPDKIGKSDLNYTIKSVYDGYKRYLKDEQGGIQFIRSAIDKMQDDEIKKAANVKLNELIR